MIHSEPECVQEAKPMVATETRCPSCSGEQSTVFYSVSQIPVHSNLMYNTKADALHVPKRDLTLAVCPHCGFIFNSSYEAADANYSPIYEDQQCFSSTFNDFSERLISRLIEKHDIHKKTVVEIGCGKGDFLTRLCELGNNIGIGIDPAVAPQRLAGANDNVTFIQDYYSEHYKDIKGDVFICRHTLEHIADTANFLNTIRLSISDQSALFVVEVPDTRRVLQELAFWDIYYEHCSYFTSGSLARLFRFCRFEVMDLWMGFQNQYMIIEAMPAKSASAHPFAIEEDVAELLAQVDRFSENIQTKQDEWQQALDRYEEQQKKVAIWGGGSKCVAFLTTLDRVEEIGCIVDINPHRAGKYLSGLSQKIAAPSALPSFKPDVVIIMNPIYKQEITTDLHKMGLSPHVLCL